MMKAFSIFTRPTLPSSQRVWALCLLVLGLGFGQSARAQGDGYLERCLSGHINNAACQNMIRNFWRHNSSMESAARATGLDPSLIRAVAAIESRFNSEARSPVGATGVMQIMPSTGRLLGVFDEEGLYHAPTNLLAGAQYLRKMYIEFGDWRLALAAYNAGPGAVRKYGYSIPPYTETQNYVVNVLYFYRLFKQAEQRALAQVQAKTASPAQTELR